MEVYAVIGNPIHHSRSPFIHQAFATQTGAALRYGAILGLPDQFAAQVAQFRAQGGRGLNVTLPYKAEAFRLADHLSARAQQAEAVNTLIFREDGSLEGDNTDGDGLCRDLARLQIPLTAQRILLLGAGGASAGILAPLLEAKPAQVHIVNRTVARAAALAHRFAPLGPVSAGGYPDLAGHQFDLILHATAAGLEATCPELPADLLAPGGSAYDLYYSAAPTAFLRWADQHGAVRRADGLGMLVEQAAASFYRWRGVWPQTAPVLTALRAHLSAQV